jgi:hypothetical protein
MDPDLDSSDSVDPKIQKKTRQTHKKETWRKFNGCSLEDKENFQGDLKVVTNEKGEAVREVVTIIC